MARNKTGIHFASDKGRVLHDALCKAQVGFDPGHPGIAQQREQIQSRRFPGVTPGNQFGQHRVIERRYLFAFADAAIHPLAAAQFR